MTIEADRDMFSQVYIRVKLPVFIAFMCMLATVCSVVMGIEALDPALAELYAGHKVRAKFGSAPSGKRVLLVDGTPTPTFWADLASLSDDYKAAGFNTTFVEFYDQGKDVPIQQAFRSWDALLLNAKRAGLYVIIYIHNSIHSSVGKSSFALDDEWQDYVQKIVKRYKGVTNLIGWNYSDEPGDAMTYPDDAFREFLAREYHSVDALNRSWATNYNSFNEIKLEFKRDGRGLPEDTMVSIEHPFGIGPKAFDSARYKLFRMSWGHQQFAKAVREVDRDTPLWSGAQNLAWAATQTPGDWGVFFDFYPGSSGDDIDTHNIWAMDIGRGPNMRPSMQMLLPENFNDPKWLLDARVIRGWMVESAIHGAAGITFWPWSFLGVDNYLGARSSSLERITMCHETINTLKTSGIFEMHPQNTIAVVYQPYAEGWGGMSQVYGVMRYPSEEPHILMQELKYGTRYGQVDYLTKFNVPGLKLDKYGIIIAQFTPDLSSNDLKKLRKYVESGGVLFSDVGFDCIRAGKTITSMTEEAMQLFGIKSLKVSTAGAGRFVATGKFSDLLGGLTRGVDGTDAISSYLLDVESTGAVAALKGPGGQGVFVNKVGKGYAIFCSGQAWSSWTVADQLFSRIHNALFSRRSIIEWLAGNSTSSVSETSTFTDSYEISRFTSGYAIQNRTDQRLNATLRVGTKTITSNLEPRSVILVNDGKLYDLGTGIWKVETGP